MPSLTRDEYVKTPRTLRLKKQQDKDTLRGLTMLSQASTKAKILTGHPAWDAYLEYLQAFLDQTEAVKAGFEQKLNDPMIVDHSDMLRAKIGLAECTAMARALTAAMELPKDIVENGDKAKSMIERMEETEGDKAA